MSEDPAPYFTNRKSKGDALERLLKLAYGDTGGSRRAAQFLLSLWNGNDFKADLQELLYVDPDIFSDMQEVTKYLYENNYQLDSLVSQSEMNPVIERWGDVFRTMRDI